jgi:hypothetical protein
MKPPESVMAHEDHDALERLEKEVTDLKFAVFGLDGENGLRSRVRELEKGIGTAQRTVLMAALTVILALLGAVIQLVVAVSG